MYEFQRWILGIDNPQLSWQSWRSKQIFVQGNWYETVSINMKRSEKKIYAPNSVPSKDVDFYNQIYELMRQKCCSTQNVSRMEETFSCFRLTPGSRQVHVLCFGDFNSDLHSFKCGLALTVLIPCYLVTENHFALFTKTQNSKCLLQ